MNNEYRVVRHERQIMIIGIGGLIGSGKTTVAMFLSKKGFLVISGDKVARYLRKDPVVIEKIKKICGKEIVEKGRISRKKLMEMIVFSDKRQRINSLFYPLIKRDIGKIIAPYLKKKRRNIVVEAPCFLEMELDTLVDCFIWIKATKRSRYQRTRQKVDREIFERLNSIQKLDRSELNPDFVIVNNGTLEDLKRKVEKILKRIGKT